MLKFSLRKKLNRLIAGTLSAAMALTMTPDIWLPVYAESVRNDILNAEVDSGNETVYADNAHIDTTIYETDHSEDETDESFFESEDIEKNTIAQPYDSKSVKYEYKSFQYYRCKL